MLISWTEPLSRAELLLPFTHPVILVLLKITLLLLAALAATVVLQRASAGARHLVWLIVLAALIVLPPLAAWAPLPLPVLPAATAMSNSPAGDASGRMLSPEQQAHATVTGAATAPSTPAAGSSGEVAGAAAVAPSLGTILLALWAVVGLALVLRLAHGAWAVRRVVRRARTLERPEWQTPLYEIADRLGLEAPPALLQSDEVKMPFAAGLVGATIVLPTESEAWSPERRSAVLIHELGHIRRRDLVGHTLSRIACALYWFHPLVWTAARRLRAESERACDDLALVFGARPSEYAEHLLDIVTCVRDHNTPAVALAMAHRKEFEGRMLAILNPELSRRAPNRREVATVVGVLATVVLLVGAAAPVARQASAMPPAGAPSSAPASDAPESAALLRAPVHGVQGVAEPRPNPAPRPDPRPAPTSVAAQNMMVSADTGPGDERAAALAKSLKSDASPRVRRVAAWGLARYADHDPGLSALVTAATGDADAEVREMAVWALAGARRNGAAGEALSRILKQEKDTSVRRTALWAAGTIQVEGSMDALVGSLGDNNPEIRELGAWAIGTICPDRAPPALIKALGDKDRDVRLSVAWALFTIRDPEATNALDEAFHREADAEVREGLITALGAMGDRSVEALSKLVASPDSEVRAVAVTALAGGRTSGPWPWPRPEPRPYP
jgi:beta-lactamase regulating signal transducer with metallopeptidase domain